MGRTLSVRAPISPAITPCASATKKRSNTIISSTRTTNWRSTKKATSTILPSLSRYHISSSCLTNFYLDDVLLHSSILSELTKLRPKAAIVVWSSGWCDIGMFACITYLLFLILNLRRSIQLFKLMAVIYYSITNKMPTDYAPVFGNHYKKGVTSTLLSTRMTSSNTAGRSRRRTWFLARSSAGVNLGVSQPNGSGILTGSLVLTSSLTKISKLIFKKN